MKSYLEQVKFDSKLNTGFVSGFIKNLRIVLLLVISIAIIGILGFINLPKRLNPEIKIPIVNVITLLPGASPENIENLVTIPLENRIKNINGIDTLSSVSRENLSLITIQFLSSVDRDTAEQQVQREVDAVSDLPAEAQTPSVAILDFENVPVWSFMIITPKSLPSLMSFTERIKTEIESSPKVDRVEVSGFEDQEISVEITPEKLNQYGLSPFLLLQGINKETASYPAGNVSNNENTFSLGIDSLTTNLEDLRNTRLNLQGNLVRLGEIARVEERSKREINESYYIAPNVPTKRAVVVYVYKTLGSNIDTAGREIEKIVEKVTADYQEQFEVVTITNYAEEIDAQFSDLLGEFRTTIILILICLFIFLGFRQAILSSLTVPLTFLSAFFLMNLFGQSVNFLTLFALLLALGLLIDDTIVVVAAMTTYYKTRRFNTFQTGRLVWRDTIIPIWSTTITTIWSFVPLLITSGIIGEFIKPIPIVVTVTMLSSTAIAVLITLPLMIWLLKPALATRVVKLGRLLLTVALFIALIIVSPKNWLLVLILPLFALLLLIFSRFYHQIRNQTVKKYWQKFADQGVLSIAPLAKKYYQTISYILAEPKRRQKVIVAILIYSAIGFALLPLGFVKNEFFPKSDSENLYLNLAFPSGTKREIVKQESLGLLKQIQKTTGLKYAALELGREMSGMGGQSENNSGAVITLNLVEEEQREKQSFEIAQELRNRFANLSFGEIQVLEESSGPPAGADLQVKLLGANLTELEKLADKTVQYLKKQPGAVNVQKSIKPSTSRIVFLPDRNKLAQYGISVETIALYSRIFASGLPLDKVNWNGSDEQQEIKLYFGRSRSLEDLNRLNWTTTNGLTLPFSELGQFVLEANPSQITRENNERTISVSAGVLPGYNIPELSKQTTDYVDQLIKGTEYTWDTGGVNEENQKSINSIIQAMGVSFILILVTMVIQFQSYRQAFIVLIVIPLAVSSVFYAFALTGTPLSFPAMIGVLSLFGIVVTNSMFVVDKININLREKMPLKEAIADAGESRLEPIILTKLNTILGLLPITLANPLWRGLGGAIISGLLIASSIMLFFIPALYYEWFKED